MKFLVAMLIIWGVLLHSTQPVAYAAANIVSSCEAGDVALKYGRAQSAVIAYTQAIREKPAEAELYINRAMAFLEMNKPAMLKDAMEDCDKALSLAPNNAFAHANKGLVYIKAKQYDKALPFCVKATELAPWSADCYYGLGLCLQAMNKTAASIEAYGRTLKLDAEYWGAYLNRGIAYLTLKNTAQALADFNTGIKAQPEDARWYYHRGLAYEMAGENDKARADYETFAKLEQNPAAD